MCVCVLTSVSHHEVHNQQDNEEDEDHANDSSDHTTSNGRCVVIWETREGGREGGRERE